jgi:hypothetical protein
MTIAADKPLLCHIWYAGYNKYIFKFHMTHIAALKWFGTLLKISNFEILFKKYRSAFTKIGPPNILSFTKHMCYKLMSSTAQYCESLGLI